MVLKKLTRTVVGFLLAIIILPEVLPLNVLVYPFLPEVEETLGRKVSIDGFIKLRLFPYVRLVVNGVRLENVKGAKHKSMVDVSSIVAKVDILPLFRKKVVLSARIVRPVLNLESFPGSKNNWTFEPQVKTSKNSQSKTNPAKRSEAKSPWKISVRDLRISGGHIEQASSDSTLKILIKTAGLGAKDISDGPYFVHARLGVEGKYYDLAIRTKGRLSAPKTPFYTTVAARDGSFDVEFLGDIIMKTLRVDGKTTIKASMQRLGLNDALLRHKAVHPRTHVVIKSLLGGDAKAITLQQTSVAIPMTTIKGNAKLKVSPKPAVDLNFATPDEASFLRLKTDVQPEQLSHKVLFNISHMKSLLGLYGIQSPVEKDANFKVSGRLVQKGPTYSVHDAVVALDDAEVGLDGNYTPVNGRMQASGSVHLKTLRKWWRVLNRDNFPGLDWVKVSGKVSENPDKSMDFSSEINMEDRGKVTASGSKKKDTVRAKVDVSYLELQDLAHHLSGDKSYKMGPFAFAANAIYTPTKTTIQDVTFKSKPIDGSGKIIVETKGPATHVTSDFKLQNLNITNLLELVDDDDGDEVVDRHKLVGHKDSKKKSTEKSSAKKDIVDPGWPTTPLVWPQNLKVKANVDIGNVTLVQPLIEQSKLRIELDKRAKINFSGTSALAKKPCHLKVDVVPRDMRRDITLDMALNDLPFNSIMGNVTDVISFGGALTTIAKISMSGASVKDLMESLSGNIGIKTKGAFIDGINLIKLSRRPESILGLAMQLLFKKNDPGVQKALGFFSLKSKNNKDRTEIYKFQSQIPIQSGKARFVNTVIDAEGLKGGIQGSIDLGGRYIDTKGSFELPDVKLKDMPPIKFHAKGNFANVHVDHTADKLKDYFLNSVLGSVIGKGVAQGLLSVLLPGVGTAIGMAASGAIDSANDAAVDAEIEKERKNKAQNKSASSARPGEPAKAHQSAPVEKGHRLKKKNPVKGLEKDLKKALGGLFG